MSHLAYPSGRPCVDAKGPGLVIQCIPVVLAPPEGLPHDTLGPQ